MGNHRLSTKSDFLHKNQRKMPYGMLQGMQKKSKDRYNAQREQDRNLGIVAESGRSKKLMQTYFEAKENVRREEKRMNLNTDRGLNLHRYTQAKYRDGALNFSKRAVQEYTSDAPVMPKMSDHSKGIQKKKKMTHE